MLTHTNYSRTILYIKKKSASCQYAIDKMQIYIYQRFLFYQCSKYHKLLRNTFHRNKSHIWKMQPTTTYIIMGIAGVFRTKRFYSSTSYFAAFVSGASPMRSMNWSSLGVMII